MAVRAAVNGGTLSGKPASRMLPGMDAKTARQIGRRLLRWYGRNARQLPWRSRPTPYGVLVSEVMLQQTVVGTVVPYFQRWMERFPDMASLAAAEEGDVLALWEGMGYYCRAQRLHRAARLIAADRAGRGIATGETLRCA